MFTTLIDLSSAEVGVIYMFGIMFFMFVMDALELM